MLKFSPENTKTKKLRKIAELEKWLAGGRKIYSLDVRSGWTCPGAKDCLAKVVEIDGKRKIQDGPKAIFRCYAASQEVLYPGLYNLRKHNEDCLRKMRGKNQCASLILQCLPQDIGIFRYHTGGGFFKKAYFDAAIEVAIARPDVLFYAYMKTLPYIKHMKDPANGVLLDNFLITASYGGKFDHLIPKLGIRTARVITDPSQAGNLPIDENDSHAATMGGSFNLLIHGTQKAGSEEMKAVVKLRGYKPNGK